MNTLIDNFTVDQIQGLRNKFMFRDKGFYVFIDHHWEYQDTDFDYSVYDRYVNYFELLGIRKPKQIYELCALHKKIKSVCTFNNIIDPKHLICFENGVYDFQRT